LIRVKGVWDDFELDEESGIVVIRPKTAYDVPPPD
jgi:hypothetical protein